MDISPRSGSFDKQFTADLIIDGRSEKFNAAEATVALSFGLAVKDLTLGDCNFSFLTTPSAQDPSFAGVILSSYSTKCTVYTLTLIPTAKTKATITLSKSSVRRYGDAANILSNASGASYNLTAALKSPVIPAAQSVNNSKNGLYTVNIKTLSAENTPVSNATVTLNSVSDNKKHQTTTDKTGTARLSNLQSGIYDAEVLMNNVKVAETIINVSGQNHVLTFGINLKAQKNNPLLKDTKSVLGASTSSPYFIAVVLTLGLVVGAIIVVLFIRLKGARKLPV